MGNFEKDRNIEHNTELYANHFEINILDLLELDDIDNINDNLRKWQLELLHSQHRRSFSWGFGKYKIDQ